MDSPSLEGLTSRIIRVRRKRSANPHSGLLVSDALEESAGPSKRAKPDFDDSPAAFRLIGTLPLPDVRDAARLFLNTNTPKASFIFYCYFLFRHFYYCIVLESWTCRVWRH